MSKGVWKRSRKAVVRGPNKSQSGSLKCKPRQGFPHLWRCYSASGVQLPITTGSVAFNAFGHRSRSLKNPTANLRGGPDFQRGHENRMNPSSAFHLHANTVSSCSYPGAQQHKKTSVSEPWLAI